MLRRRTLIATGLALGMGCAAADDFAAAREAMVREIERDLAETASYTGRARLAPRVRAALAKVQ